MQTFLPYPCFRRSAAVLDDRRLGKQRVEVLQVLRALHLDGYGWSHHPAVRMWGGHTRALVAYGLAIVEEWCRRGHADTTLPNIVEFTYPQAALPEPKLPPAELPPWLGMPALHRSHRAALVRKAPEIYRAVFPDASPTLPYVWPEPAPRPHEEAFSGWLVRATSDEVLAVFRAEGLVGLPAHFGTSPVRSRNQRQFKRLHGAIAGDRVIMPEGSDLRRGRLLGGGVVERGIAREPYATRTVVWDGILPRSSLRRPYQLQDPQLMFALRGERVLSD